MPCCLTYCLDAWQPGSLTSVPQAMLTRAVQSTSSDITTRCEHWPAYFISDKSPDQHRRQHKRNMCFSQPSTSCIGDRCVSFSWDNVAIPDSGRDESTWSPPPLMASSVSICHCQHQQSGNKTPSRTISGGLFTHRIIYIMA